MQTVAEMPEFRHKTALKDAVERLEENADGVPFVRNVSPWEERYGWLFENPGSSSTADESADPGSADPRDAESALDDDDATF